MHQGSHVSQIASNRKNICDWQRGTLRHEYNCHVWSEVLPELLELGTGLYPHLIFQSGLLHLYT